MSLRVPRALSPSKLHSFGTCGLQFRWKNVEYLPEPPSRQAEIGNLVHEVLENVFYRYDRPARTLELAQAELDYLAPSYPTLEDAELQTAWACIENLWQLEEPNDVTVMGCELRVTGTVGGAPMNGIIDRLELEGDKLVAIDYKTGKPPRKQDERDKLHGLMLYSLMLEQMIGRRPDLVRLYYLAKPLIIEAVPTGHIVKGLELRSTAMWDAIQRACENENFRPKPSALCSWCTWQSICPAWRECA